MSVPEVPWRPGQVAPLPNVIEMGHTPDLEFIVLTVVDPTGRHTVFLGHDVARQVKELIERQLLECVSGIVVPKPDGPDLNGGRLLG